MSKAEADVGMRPEKVELTVTRDGVVHNLGVVHGGHWWQRLMTKRRIRRWNKSTLNSAR